MFVLIVEDNLDSAQSLAMLLRLWGHQAQVAHDGPAALDLATRQKPDVVLADIGLPGMDGFELTERLTARPELRGTRIAAVTAYADEDSRLRGRAAGFDEHFAKPVDVFALSRWLDKNRD